MKRVTLRLYVGRIDAFGVAAPEAFMPAIIERLESKFDTMRARKPGEQQRQHFGFATVMPDDGAPLFIQDNEVLTLCMQREAKVIPADTVKQRIEQGTKEALLRLNADLAEGEEPVTELPWEDERQIKEAVMLEMMKTDQTVRTRLLFQLISMNAELFILAVQSSSNGMVEPALNLLRTALDTLPVIPVSNLINSYPFNSWVAGFALNREELINPELDIKLGVNCELSTADKASVKIKDLGKVDNEWLKMTLSNMQVSSVELYDEGWDCILSRHGEVRQLMISGNSERSAGDDSDPLTLFRADQYLLGHWVKDFMVVVLPTVYNTPDMYNSDSFAVDADDARSDEIAGCSKEQLKLQTWQVENGYRAAPAEDAMSANPFADEDYATAKAFVTETKKASISALQRHMRIGYNRAARIVEELERNGVVSAPSHNGERVVIQ